MSFVLKMIKEGEHQQQDFKLRIDDSNKIAKSLVAFANTNGGRLLIGVKDNGTVSHINSEEELHMVEAAATMYCEPNVKYISQVWKIDNLSVLEIYIEPSDNRPHFALDKNDQKTAYIRKNDQNIKANGVLIEYWNLEKEKQDITFLYDEEKEKLFKYLRGKESISFLKTSRITKLSFDNTEEMLAKLIAWNIIKINIHEKAFSYSLKDN